MNNRTWQPIPYTEAERRELERQRQEDEAEQDAVYVAAERAELALRAAGVANNQIGRAMMYIEDGRFDEMRFSSEEKRQAVKAIYEDYWKAVGW